MSDEDSSKEAGRQSSKADCRREKRRNMRVRPQPQSNGEVGQENDRQAFSNGPKERAIDEGGECDGQGGGNSSPSL